MGDPTYIKEQIDNNSTWKLAFKFSEMVNDTAPIGWGKYIYIADYVLTNFEVKEEKSNDRQTNSKNK